MDSKSAMKAGEVRPDSKEDHMEEFKGAGWYRIAFSDGGQDWTNDGPVWLDDQASFEDEMGAARRSETETHMAYAEYLGDGDSPEM